MGIFADYLHQLVVHMAVIISIHKASQITENFHQQCVIRCDVIMVTGDVMGLHFDAIKVGFSLIIMVVTNPRDIIENAKS